MFGFSILTAKMKHKNLKLGLNVLTTEISRENIQKKQGKYVYVFLLVPLLQQHHAISKFIYFIHPQLGCYKDLYMFSEPTSLQCQIFALQTSTDNIKWRPHENVKNNTQALVFEKKTGRLDPELQIQGIKEFHSLVLAVEFSILLGSPALKVSIPLSGILPSMYSGVPGQLNMEMCQENKGIQHGPQQVRNPATSPPLPS